MYYKHMYLCRLYTYAHYQTAHYNLYRRILISAQILAECFKIQHNFTSVMQLKGFLDFTNEVYSLMTDLLAIVCTYVHILL